MQPFGSVSASDLQAFLDTPEQLLHESVELQLAFASFLDTPRSLLSVLVNSPDEQVAEAASLHVNYAGEIADNWQQLVSEILHACQLGQNDRLAVELLKLGGVPPCFLSEWVPADKLILALRNPQMPLRYKLELLERLAQEPTLEPRLQVAESPETPLAVLEQLAGDLELPVRLAVKFNPSCPPALIELVEGQHALASDWNGDGELAMLGQSRWAWIRLTVAQNSNTPQGILMELARDSVYKIQLAVAKNPGTSSEVLALLAGYEDESIQVAVAEHANLTEDIMHLLFPSQQSVLKSRKNLPTSILERFFNERATDKPLWKNYRLQHLLLSHANTPTWILTELANVDLQALRAEKLNSDEQEMLELDFNNPDINKAFEKSILDDIRFLSDIAKHPQVSLEILETLVNYPNPFIKLAVAQNYQIPDVMKMRLFEELFFSNEERIIQELASNQNTPVSILKKIGEQELPQNKLPIKLRRLLTRDSNEDNRESVADACMDELRKILAQYQVDVDVEEWMMLINSYQWMTLLENYTYYGDLKGRYRKDTGFRDMVNEQWQQLLPTLPDFALQEVIDNILRIPDLLVDVIKGDHYISVALVGNPNTPVALHEELQRRLTRPVGERYQSKDDDMRMALAYNTRIPEVERMGYFQSLIAENRSYLNANIAKNPLTPLNILEQLLEGGEQEGIAKNPAIPEYFLRRIADLPQLHDSILRTIAENKNAPADLLIRFVHHPHDKKTISNVSIYEIVIANPNLPAVERHRLILEKEEAEEIAKAHELMARRSDSPYCLAQVIEKGDQKAKITAARSNKTPIHVLEQLARDTDEIVRRVVSENFNLPLKILLELARDNSTNVRLNLLYKLSNKKVQAPIQLLELFAQDESEQVRAKVAEHPDITVELLVCLANDSSREVKSAVVKNIKTPTSILEKLGLEENIFAVRNPHTPGTVLAQAVNKTTGYKSHETLRDLIKQSGWTKDTQMPSDVLDELSYHKDSGVRMEVADHHKTSISTLERLSNDEYLYVRLRVAQNPNTPPHALEQIVRYEDTNIDDDYYYTLCLDISRRPDTPSSALEFFSYSRRADIRNIVAYYPNTSLETLARMVVSETNEFVLKTLADNHKLTSNLLLTLAQKPYWSVRKVLIEHPNMTSELWKQLAKDEVVELRQAIASQSNCPIIILENLASDENDEVRVAVATNFNTPASTLEILAGDSNSHVRTAVASNPNLTETTLTQLASDEKVEVRRAVVINPNTPPSIRESLRDLIVQPTKQQTISPTLRGLSRLYNPSTDDLPTILTEYARSKNAFVRFITLMNPQTPVDVLTQAAQSESWLERYAVADNSATLEQIRQQLTQDSNRIVRAAAKANL